MSAAPVRVFLCGEGATELGSRSGHPLYQSDEDPGVLAALLKKTTDAGWEVGGARKWKDVGLYSTGDYLAADGRRVLQAAQEARERGCEVLAFSRDRDNDERRAEIIREGMERCEAIFADDPEVIGGLAIPAIEAWVLACKGHGSPESMGRERTARELKELGVEHLADMVLAIEAADLSALPSKATSLRAWLALAGRTLPGLIQKRSAAAT